MSHKPEDFAHAPNSFKARNPHLYAPGTIHRDTRVYDAIITGKPPTSHPSVKAAKIKSQSQKLKDRFIDQWIFANGPELETEYRFHDVRKWRFDYAIPKIKVAIELQGGLFVNGGHNRGRDMEGDFEKYNSASLDGWTVFQLGTNMMTDKFIRPLTMYCNWKLSRYAVDHS